MSVENTIAIIVLREMIVLIIFFGLPRETNHESKKVGDYNQDNDKQMLLKRICRYFFAIILAHIICIYVSV